VCYKHTREGGSGKELISVQTFSKQKLERQKGQKQACDKLMFEMGQLAVHKAHLLSQQTTSKVKWHCKIEKQSANHHNKLTAGGWVMDCWPCPRERNRPPVNPHSKNPTAKQGGWWATVLIYRTLEQATPHWGRSWLSSCHWKTKKKKTGKTSQSPGKIKTEPLLTYQHQDWMLKE
jgi:hypothetical protein